MRWSIRVLAFMILAISGLSGGSIFISNWRMLALAIIAGLAFILGINMWRATYADRDIELGKEKGIFRMKLHPVIMIPIIGIAFGAALAGLLVNGVTR